MRSRSKVEDWIRLSSSAVRKARYHPVSRRLDLIYPDGGAYCYFRFPRMKFEALLHAESKGRFVNEQIKPKHRYKRIPG